MRSCTLHARIAQNEACHSMRMWPARSKLTPLMPQNYQCQSPVAFITMFRPVFLGHVPHVTDTRTLSLRQGTASPARTKASTSHTISIKQGAVNLRSARARLGQACRTCAVKVGREGWSSTLRARSELLTAHTQVSSWHVDRVHHAQEEAPRRPWRGLSSKPRRRPANSTRRRRCPRVFRPPPPSAPDLEAL